MDLRTPSPYWLLRHGIVNSYPSLQCNTRADVAIIGAGISGALVAASLLKTGRSIILLDRRHAAMGSTAASTALLQYEIDVPLVELSRLVGKKHAARSYLLCRQAIDELERICSKLKDPRLFARKPSFQFASVAGDVPLLREEYLRRKRLGFGLRWLTEAGVGNRFGFLKPAGILSEDGAEADAYLITHRLLEKCIRGGVKVFDNTEVTGITHRKNGVTLTTANGFQVNAGKLVIACGYESQRYISKKVQYLHSTYAIASEPFGSGKFWHRNALIWETATPYLYLRTTADNRILIGGKDSPFSNPSRRDAALTRKARELERSFVKLFPAITFRTDFKWAGTFAASKDGLPYIGSIPERPHTYFALGFGGNGITFSVVAAKIICDLIEGKKNPDAEIFSFNR